MRIGCVREGGEEGEGEGQGEDKGEDKEGRGEGERGSQYKTLETLIVTLDDPEYKFLRHPLIAKCLLRGMDVVQRPPGDDKWDDADDADDDDDYEGDEGDADEENETEMESLN